MQRPVMGSYQATTVGNQLEIQRPRWWPNQPVPPGQNYTIPAGATVVSTIDQLATELYKSTAEDISVAPGTYSRSSPVANAGAPTLAQTTGGSLAVGTTYDYLITYLSPQGETMGTIASVTITTGNSAVTISWSNPTGIDARITGVKVYGRTHGSTLFRLPTQPGSLTTLSITDLGATIISNTKAPTRNTTSGYLTPGAAHRIWCQSYNGCAFDFGLEFNNLKSWQVRGGVFTIASQAQAADDGSGNYYACIGNWLGTTLAINATITDVTLSGVDPAATTTPTYYGIFLGQGDGCTVQRVVASYLSHEGFCANDNHTNSSAAMNTVSDILAQHIYDNSRGDLNGQHEYGIQIGNTVTNGVSRITARDCGWGGMLTVNNCRNTTFSDLDFDSCWGYEPTGSGNHYVGFIESYGIYVERYTHNCTFQRFRLGVSGDIERGINNEWDYGMDYNLAQAYTVGNTTMYLSNGNLTHLPASGTIQIGNTTNLESTGTVDTISYTGTQASPLALTGCSGGIAGNTYPVGTYASNIAGGNAASHSNTYKDGTIYLNSTRTPERTKWALHFDVGTTYPTIRDVSVRGARYGAIIDLTGNPPASAQASSQLTTYFNDLSGYVNSDVYYGVVPSDPPTGVTATASTAQASLSWTAGYSSGGASVTDYVIIPYKAGVAQTAVHVGSSATSYTVTALTSGISYTFTVAAINSAGTGTQSSPSNAVTPS